MRVSLLLEIRRRRIDLCVMSSFHFDSVLMQLLLGNVLLGSEEAKQRVCLANQSNLPYKNFLAFEFLGDERPRFDAPTHLATLHKLLDRFLEERFLQCVSISQFHVSTNISLSSESKQGRSIAAHRPRIRAWLRRMKLCDERREKEKPW